MKHRGLHLTAATLLLTCLSGCSTSTSQTGHVPQVDRGSPPAPAEFTPATAPGALALAITNGTIHLATGFTRDTREALLDALDTTAGLPEHYLVREPRVPTFNGETARAGVILHLIFLSPLSVTQRTQVSAALTTAYGAIDPTMTFALTNERGMAAQFLCTPSAASEVSARGTATVNLDQQELNALGRELGSFQSRRTPSGDAQLSYQGPWLTDAQVMAVKSILASAAGLVPAQVHLLALAH